MTSDVILVNNEDLRLLIMKGTKLGSLDSSHGVVILYISLIPLKFTPSDGQNLQKKDLDTLSERVKSIRCLLKSRVVSVFNKAEVRKELERLHD